MDLEKRYETVDGVKCNILQMVKLEPEWAANILQMGERAIEELNNRKPIEITCLKCGEKSFIR